MAHDGVVLEKGETVLLTTDDIKGDLDRLPVDYHSFQEIAKPGQRVLLDDGLIVLEITDKEAGRSASMGTGAGNESELTAVVRKGGPVFSRKGINLPDSHLTQKGLTHKDRQDLKFGIDNDLDFVGISFVGDGDDVREVRRSIRRSGRNIRIISKIERAVALQNINEIIHVSDGILVARGDLGVEVPIEMLPLFQKDLIKRCGAGGRLVITATHMLESMINNRIPTRAEVLDVANSVLDGTDVVMLSAETAVGKHPEEAVSMMSRIVTTAESISQPMKEHFREILHDGSRPPMSVKITQNVAYAAGQFASSLGAKSILAFSSSGATALMLSKTRHRTPIIALSPNEKVCRQMRILWGVTPMVISSVNSTDEMIGEVEKAAIRSNLLKKKDIVVLTAGLPVWVKKRTNMIKVHEIGSGHWQNNPWD